MDISVTVCYIFASQLYGCVNKFSMTFLSDGCLIYPLHELPLFIYATPSQFSYPPRFWSYFSTGFIVLMLT